MAVSELMQVSPSCIPAISSHIQNGLEREGFAVSITECPNGSYEIKASKPLISGFCISSIIKLDPYGTYHVMFNAEKEEYFTDIARIILITICTAGTFLAIYLMMQLVVLLSNSAWNNRARLLALEAVSQVGDAAHNYASAPTGNSASNPEPAQPKLSRHFCVNCGTENLADSKFCVNCGSPLTSMPESNERVQTPSEQPVSEPVVEPVEQPKPVCQPRSVDRRPKSTSRNKFIMTITKSMSYSGMLLLKGICEGVVRPGEYIRIESEEGHVVVTKVSSVEVYGISRPESAIGKEVVLTVEQVENFHFSAGDKVYLK